MAPVPIIRCETPAAQEEVLVAWTLARCQVGAGAVETMVVVPGGSTPEPFFHRLAATDLPWARTTFGLTDERCVPVEDPRGNESLLRRCLPRARLEPLLDDAGQGMVETVSAPDVVILGMGADGHVASLFPGSPLLADPRQDVATRPLPVPPRGEIGPRVTRTYAGLRGRRGTALLIRGEPKRALLEGSAWRGLPVGRCLDDADLAIFWCP